MFIPLYLQDPENNAVLLALGDFNGLWYNLLFFLMIVVFTYFYTAITVNPNQMADDLKRQNSFIPGVKPGKPTADFLDDVLSRITLPGAVFLGLIAVLPAVMIAIGLVENQGFAMFFGGTSLCHGWRLLDTSADGSYLLSRRYDGLMKSGKLRGRPQSLWEESG